MSRVVALVLFATACSVQRPGPLDRPYPCAIDADCVEGFDCVDGSALGLPGFCAPSCRPGFPESCPGGVCTADGACVSGCTPNRDGTLRVDCPSGLTCVRSDLFRDEGLCWDVSGCSLGTDCDGTDVPTSCLSEVIGVPAVIAGLPIASNRLYCIAAPQGPLGDRCPEGSIPIPAVEDYPGVCLPTCNDAGDGCPPGMTCWRDLGWIFSAPLQSVCWVGVWGAPCDSDTDCLFGSCEEVGGRTRVCTERCDDVAIGASCDALASVRAYIPGGLEWVCRRVSGQDVCVPSGAIGAPCGVGRDCLAALQCVQFGGASVCTRACAVDEDCYLREVGESRREEVFCDPEQFLCLPQRGAAATCASDHECLSGRCLAQRCAS